jgi:chemotaxis protein MotB
LTFLALVVAAGATYGAYREHVGRGSAVLDATKLKGDVDAREEQLASAKTHASDLERELADCSAGRAADKTKQEETEKLAQDTANHLNATRVELDELRREHAEADKRLATFKAVSEKLRKMIDLGKLEVTIRHGRMMVKLPAGVLFASGSAQLSTEGQGTIKEVAGALREFRDRRYMVAGHTDNVPIGPSNYKSNWELSTARALTVTEDLASAGMNPSKLVAAGYGEYDPIRPNGTEAGRTENRRIEIVLLPNVEELSPMLKDGSGASGKVAAKTSK